MKSLTQTLQKQKDAGNLIFVPYIMAGANGLDQLAAEIALLEENGATAIEIGVPFSDPVADGPVIQDAGLKALANQVTLKKIIQELQKIKTSVPLVLMGYANSFFHYGLAELLKDLKKTNVKGLIIPDLPYEHKELIAPSLKDQDIALIQLVSLTSPKERIETLVNAGEGFVYAVTINGITGGQKGYDDSLDEHLKKITELSPIPVLAGFGVATPAHVERFFACCDGVVVGSKIVKTLAEEGQAAAGALVRDLTLNK